MLALTIPLVHYLHTRGLFEERLRQAQLSIEAANQINDLKTTAYMFIASIGWIHIRRGEWEQAERNITKGVDIARQINLIDAMVLGHAHLARVALSQGEVEVAESLIVEVENMDVPAVIECRIHFMRGLIDAKKGNWNDAEFHIRNAMNVLSRVTDHLWPALYIALADILLSKNNLEEAENIYRQSLAFSERMARVTDTADSWFGLARIYYQRGEYRKAGEYAQIALTLFQRYRSQTEVEKTLTLIEAIRNASPFYARWVDSLKPK